MADRRWKIEFLVDDNGLVWEDDYIAENYRQFYSFPKKNTGRPGLIEWMEDRQDNGEMEEFTCDYFRAKTLDEAIKALQAMSYEDFRNEFMPALREWAREPLPFQSDDRYWDVEWGITNGWAAAAKCFGRRPSSVLSEIGLHYTSDPDGYVLDDIETANEVCKRLKIRWVFRYGSGY